MPPPISNSIATRKRTRSTNVTENNPDHQSIVVSSTPITHTATSSNTSGHLLTRSNNGVTISGLPKRQRNNPPTTPAAATTSVTAVNAPPVPPRSIYSLRNRSLTPDPRQTANTRFPSLQTSPSRSVTRPRYNLRRRRPQSQVRLPDIPTPYPVVAPRRLRRPTVAQLGQRLSASTSSLLNIRQTSTISIPPSAPPPEPPPPSMTPIVTSVVSPMTFSIPPAIQPRQYRLVYISDDDDDLPSNPQGSTTLVNTTINLVTDDEDEEYIRPPMSRRGASRSISGPGLQTRLRSTLHPASALSTSSSASTSTTNSSNSLTTINTQDFVNGVAHIRLNRAIEIVIDSIQSLEGAVNNFDQLVLGLIYGPMTARTEFESIEGMIRLSRILNLNIPSRLTQEEIDALPKIKFETKSNQSSSILLVEKCPICLTEFDDQETINKLHCTHLFHLPCISTWLSENDSCPTCRRKVISEPTNDE